MFHVTLVNLAADASAADIAFDRHELGELSADQVLPLLERFAQLDAVANAEAEPQIKLSARAGKFIVRTGRGRLFLYQARDAAQSYAELTAPEIVAQLLGDGTTGVSADAPPGGTEGTRPAPRQTPANRGIAAAMLAAGLALNAYTVHSAFNTATVNPPPAVTLVTDAAEAGNRLREIAGTYATGSQPGDRVIEIRADGTALFSAFGAKGVRNYGSETFKLGKHGGKFALALRDAGLIEIQNLDTVVYYRDTYRRTK
jgi:hypothetical protein